MGLGLLAGWVGLGWGKVYEDFWWWLIIGRNCVCTLVLLLHVIGFIFIYFFGSAMDENTGRGSVFLLS